MFNGCILQGLLSNGWQTLCLTVLSNGAPQCMTTSDRPWWSVAAGVEGRNDKHYVMAAPLLAAVLKRQAQSMHDGTWPHNGKAITWKDTVPNSAAVATQPVTGVFRDMMVLAGARGLSGDKAAQEVVRRYANPPDGTENSVKDWVRSSGHTASVHSREELESLQPATAEWRKLVTIERVVHMWAHC